jgi:hypothetical protein
MYDVDDTFIISYCDILTDVKKVLAEFAESFLYLLQLGILFCEG